MRWLKNSIPNTMLTRLFTAFCKMGIVVITAQYFGASGRGFIGILAYAMTFLMLLSEFVGGSSIITLVPNNKIKDLLIPSYLWATVVCFFGYIALPFFPEVPVEMHVHIFWLSLILAFVTINYSILIGKQKIVWQNWSSLSIVLSNLVFLFIVLVLMHKTDVIHYVYGLYLGELLGLLVGLYFLFSHFREEFNGKFILPEGLFKLGFLSQTGHLIQFLNYRLSYVYILEYIGQSGLGVYSTVFVLPETIWIFGNSIGTVLHMKVVNEITKVESVKLTWKYTKLSALLTLGLIISVVLIPASFWSWLLGEEFFAIKEVFYWLIPGTLALGISTCISHYYHAIKRFVVLIWASFIGLAIKVSILSYYSSELTLNIVGAASSLGLIGIAIYLFIRFYRESKRD